MNLLDNKVSYSVTTINPFTNEIYSGSWRRHVKILSNPVVTFGSSILYTSNIDSGDQYGHFL